MANANMQGVSRELQPPGVHSLPCLYPLKSVQIKRKYSKQEECEFHSFECAQIVGFVPYPSTNIAE